MKEFKLKKGSKVAVIVAHPDDETIWMGGTILLQPQLNWIIYSLCRGDDKDRAPKFYRVCQYYKAIGIIDDIEDENIMKLSKSVEIIEKQIVKHFINENINYIFTHGDNGEYGHIRHMGVNRAIKKLLKEKILQPQAVFYFNYKKNKKKSLPSMIAKKDSDVFIKLPQKIYRQKRKIVAEMYGYPYDGVDVNYCTNEEAFKVKNLKINV